MRNFLLILLVGLLTGCAASMPWPACNQNVPDGSLLKRIADENKMCLEDIGNTLIIANAVAIGSEWYTREDARNAVNRWLEMLDADISYMGFRSEVYAAVKKYPGLFEVMDIYFMRFQQESLPIMDTDRELLKNWLNDRVLPILQEP